MSRQFIHEEHTTRDGRKFVIREARLDDAPRLISHTKAVLAEPEWMITELDEFNISVDDEEEWILTFARRPHSLLLVADVGESAGDDEFAGMCSVSTETRRRVRHRSRIGISVAAGYRGVGVGETLLRTVIDWAKRQPALERLELSVFGHNTRAINLYRKVGFIEMARLPRAFKLSDGTYYDDVIMGLDLVAHP